MAHDEIGKCDNDDCTKAIKLVFMDINMPELDGLETTKEICKY